MIVRAGGRWGRSRVKLRDGSFVAGGWREIRVLAVNSRRVVLNLGGCSGFTAERGEGGNSVCSGYPQDSDESRIRCSVHALFSVHARSRPGRPRSPVQPSVSLDTQIVQSFRPSERSRIPEAVLGAAQEVCEPLAPGV